MTARAGAHRLAARLGVAGGAAGMAAGAAQVAVGPTIPAWTGDKDSPVALGLLTIALSAAALVAAAMLTVPAPTPTRRAVAAAALLVPAALCLTTVGRLWYPAGALLLGAFVSLLVAGGVREPWAATRAHWTRVLVTLLGTFELLMAAGAGPTATIAVGACGGVALTTAPWVAGRSRGLGVALLLVGTVPFAALTWWSVASPLLAVVALAIGLPLVRRSPASAPDRAPTPGGRRTGEPTGLVSRRPG